MINADMNMNTMKYSFFLGVELYFPSIWGFVGVSIEVCQVERDLEKPTIHCKIWAIMLRITVLMKFSISEVEKKVNFLNQMYSDECY